MIRFSYVLRDTSIKPAVVIAQQSLSVDGDISLGRINNRTSREFNALLCDLQRKSGLPAAKILTVEETCNLQRQSRASCYE
jgi:hypothetical protein